MIIDLPTLHALEQLAVEVRVSGSLRRKEFVKTLRRRAIAKLNEAAASYAVDLTEDHIVYTVIPGKPDAWGCNAYRCRWEPATLAAELVGGPKDGQILQMASPRQEITFQMLAPDWRKFAAEDPGGLVPKVIYTYRRTGFNLAISAHVFTADELPARV
jgi:hypothetical protein